jgi:hypothetical protein
MPSVTSQRENATVQTIGTYTKERSTAQLNFYTTNVTHALDLRISGISRRCPLAGK